MSRVDDTHNSIKQFLENERNDPRGGQSERKSLEVMTQMMIEVNETLAIMCDTITELAEKLKKEAENYIPDENDFEEEEEC